MGVIAREDIKVGEKLLSIPLSLCITFESIVADGESSIGAQCVMLRQFLKSPYSVFAVYLATTPTSSQIEIYRRTLPRAFPTHPLIMSDAEVEKWAAGSHLLVSREVLLAGIRDDYSTLVESGSVVGLSPLVLSLSDFRIWFVCVLSRVFLLDVPAAASCKNVDTKNSSESDTTPPRECLAMVPLLDLFNHRNGDEDVAYRLTASPTPHCLPDDDKTFSDEIPLNPLTTDTHELAVELHALRAVLAGQQVFDSYGARDNCALSLCYGFAVPENKLDRALLAFEFQDMLHAFAVRTCYAEAALVKLFSFLRFLMADDSAGQLRVFDPADLVHATRPNEKAMFDVYAGLATAPLAEVCPEGIDIVSLVSSFGVQPLSVEHEDAVLMTLAQQALMSLKHFPWSLADDAVSAQYAADPAQQLVARVTLGEKTVLTFFLNLANICLNRVPEQGLAAWVCGMLMTDPDEPSDPSDLMPAPDRAQSVSVHHDEHQSLESPSRSRANGHLDGLPQLFAADDVTSPFNPLSANHPGHPLHAQSYVGHLRETLAKTFNPHERAAVAQYVRAVYLPLARLGTALLHSQPVSQAAVVALRNSRRTPIVKVTLPPLASDPSAESTDLVGKETELTPELARLQLQAGLTDGGHDLLAGPARVSAEALAELIDSKRVRVPSMVQALPVLIYNAKATSFVVRVTPSTIATMPAAASAAAENSGSDFSEDD